MGKIPICPRCGNELLRLITNNDNDFWCKYCQIYLGIEDVVESDENKRVLCVRCGGSGVVTVKNIDFRCTICD